MSYPKTLEQLTESAKAAFEKNNYSEAARIFLHLRDQIDPVQQPLEYAEVSNNLSVAFLKDGRPQAALDAVIGTDAVFANYGQKTLQAMALGNIGAALTDLQRFDEALSHYQQSAAIFEETGSKELRGYVMEQISVVQMKRGKQVESLFAMDAALQSRKAHTWREVILKKLMTIVHRRLKTG